MRGERRRDGFRPSFEWPDLPHTSTSFRNWLHTSPLEAVGFSDDGHLEPRKVLQSDALNVPSRHPSQRLDVLVSLRRVVEMDGRNCKGSRLLVRRASCSVTRSRVSGVPQMSGE